MAYRDERDALRGRVEKLEQELDEAKRQLQGQRPPDRGGGTWALGLWVLAVLPVVGGAMVIGFGWFGVDSFQEYRRFDDAPMRTDLAHAVAHERGLVEIDDLALDVHRAPLVGRALRRELETLVATGGAASAL